MTTSSLVNAAVAAYRVAAATAFSNFRGKQPRPLKQQLSKVPVCDIPYQRSSFPALEQYLQSASDKFSTFKQQLLTCSTVTESRKRNTSKALGTSSKPVLSIAAEVRRQRWLVYLSEARHRLNVRLSSVQISHPIPCGIPLDIRMKYASLKRTTKIIYKKRFQFSTSKLGKVNVDEQLLLPCLEHTERCEQSIENGSTCLQPLTQKQMQVDTFDAVRIRYQGKPDELYRRKTSKKFAAWRRRMRDADLIVSRHESNAEHKMKISRGYDQLLTQRSYGDTSFVPFLYETDSHAYAFSSRISDAPKLRKAMIDKYSAKDTNEQVDLLQKAHIAAETNPLFHTRVMNRFS